MNGCRASYLTLCLNVQSSFRFLLHVTISLSCMASEILIADLLSTQEKHFNNSLKCEFLQIVPGFLTHRQQWLHYSWHFIHQITN